MKTSKKQRIRKVKSAKGQLKENQEFPLVARNIDCSIEEFMKREGAMNLEEFKNWCQDLISKYES